MKRILLPLMLAASMLVATPAVARGDGTLRSGSIVSGTGQSPANFWVRGMEGCVGAPACSAWLQSACRPGLAGKNPAVHASIVDVGRLADGVTERVLDVRPGVGLNWGHFVVQFWTGTNLSRFDYCRELVRGQFWSWECGYRTGLCRFTIPKGARWMTITSSPDNTNVHWTLR